jgi:hypothetical protein
MEFPSAEEIANKIELNKHVVFALEMVNEEIVIVDIGMFRISEEETIYQVSTTSHTSPTAPAILRDDIPIEDLAVLDELLEWLATDPAAL